MLLIITLARFSWKMSGMYRRHFQLKHSIGAILVLYGTYLPDLLEQGPYEIRKLKWRFTEPLIASKMGNDAVKQKMPKRSMGIVT